MSDYFIVSEVTSGISVQKPVGPTVLAFISLHFFQITYFIINHFHFYVTQLTKHFSFSPNQSTLHCHVVGVPRVIYCEKLLHQWQVFKNEVYKLSLRLKSATTKMPRPIKIYFSRSR